LGLPIHFQESSEGLRERDCYGKLYFLLPYRQLDSVCCVVAPSHRLAVWLWVFNVFFFDPLMKQLERIERGIIQSQQPPIIS